MFFLLICFQFAYMVFLALFSYVILIRQDKIPSISEMVLIIFVCTLCTEEIRQVFKPRLNLTFELEASKFRLLRVCFLRLTIGHLLLVLCTVHFLHKRELRKFQVSVVQWWLRKEPNGLTCSADFVFLLIKLIAFLGSSLSFRCRRRCVSSLMRLIGQDVSYVMPEIVWSLSKDEFELHTSAGSEAFSL